MILMLVQTQASPRLLVSTVVMVALSVTRIIKLCYSIRIFLLAIVKEYTHERGEQENSMTYSMVMCSSNPWI